MAELVIPFSDLDQKQRVIVDEAVYKKGSIFVEGPPGSGKTSISLQIIRTLIGEEVVKPLVLIYNNSLLGYLKSSFDQLGITDSVTINTKDKFYWSLKRQYNIQVDNNADYNTKREQILESLLERDLDLSYSILILDEIQDFSDLEWRFLKSLSNRFILLGDFEQRVYSSDLQKSTLLQTTRHRILDKIFRFGEMIADLVQLFSKDKKDLKSLVVRKNDTIPDLLDCNSLEEENREIASIIKARKNDGGRIAIISINRDRLSELHNYLSKQDIDHLHVENNKDFAKYDFSSNTPVLITSASAKGLEFRTVIVTGFDEGSRAVYGFRAHGGFEENIYVCLSRATKHLYVLRNPNTVKELKDLETVDQSEDIEDDWFI